MTKQLIACLLMAAAASASLLPEEFVGVNLQCGDSCVDSTECRFAQDCNLCLSGICQHRCVENGTCNEEPAALPKPTCDAKESFDNVILCALQSCTTYADCSGECNLCLDGQCTHRCAEEILQ